MSEPDPIAAEDAAQRALCAALRRVMELARVSEAPVAVAEQARAALAQAEQLLAPWAHPGPYSQSGHGARGAELDEGAQDPNAFFPYSPLIGARNPIAPPLVFRCEEGVVRADANFGPLYVGPPGSVHGGVVAAAFDELLGAANLVNRVGAFTGTLTVRYRSLTPLQQPLRLEGRVDRIEGRKVFASGTLHHAGRLTAEAEGVFIRPGPAERQSRGERVAPRARG